MAPLILGNLCNPPRRCRRQIRLDIPSTLGGIVSKIIGVW